MAVFLDQLKGDVTGWIVVVNKPVGQLAGFEESATGRFGGCRVCGWERGEQVDGRRMGHALWLRGQDAAFELFFFGDGVGAF